MELVDEDRQKEIISYFKGKNPLYFPGGSAPNTILACAGLGINSHIAGRIGNDKLGDIYDVIEAMNFRPARFHELTEEDIWGRKNDWIDILEELEKVKS